MYPRVSSQYKQMKSPTRMESSAIVLRLLLKTKMRKDVVFLWRDFAICRELSGVNQNGLFPVFPIQISEKSTGFFLKTISWWLASKKSPETNSWCDKTKCLVWPAPVLAQTDAQTLLPCCLARVTLPKLDFFQLSLVQKWGSKIYVQQIFYPAENYSTFVGLDVSFSGGRQHGKPLEIPETVSIWALLTETCRSCSAHFDSVVGQLWPLSFESKEPIQDLIPWAPW